MILPIVRETVVSAHSADKIKENLRKVILPGKRIGLAREGYLFTGSIKENAFDITRIISRPENFMPQVQGKIETTSSGCIIFLKYTLQFSSRMFVVFWSLSTLFFALFLWFLQLDVFLGLGAMVAMILNLAITHINFRRKLKTTRQTLYYVINN